MKHILLGSLIASVVISSSLFAKDDKSRESDKRRGADHAERSLRTIDTDQDGKVSVEEYMAHSQQRFEALDMDGDNFVTIEEGQLAAAAMRKKHDEARSALEKRDKEKDKGKSSKSGGE